MFAQPKQRRGRQQKPPLAELGEHPDSGAPVRVLDGRYGPYVTDGTTNATVPRGSDPAELTLPKRSRCCARAPSMAPSKAKKAAKKTAKKATKKAAKKPAKKAAKKTHREEGGESDAGVGRAEAGRPRRAVTTWHVG